MRCAAAAAAAAAAALATAPLRRRVAAAASARRAASHAPHAVITTTSAAMPPPSGAAEGGAASVHASASASATAAAAAAASSPSLLHAWAPLGVRPEELRLDVTLPTGQTFRCAAPRRQQPQCHAINARARTRNADTCILAWCVQFAPWYARSWRRGAAGEYTGVVGSRVFALRQTEDDVLFRLLPLRPAPTADTSALAAPPLAPAAERAAAASALREYLALDIPLAPLHAHFCAVDERFRALQPYVRGARLLRQEPCECLFAFICSSNNHVARIAGMVERLCAAYGTCLGAEEEGVEGGEKEGGEGAPLRLWYAFPTAAQLARAEEGALRTLGFGYRAKARTATSLATHTCARLLIPDPRSPPFHPLPPPSTPLFCAVHRGHRRGAVVPPWRRRRLPGLAARPLGAVCGRHRRAALLPGRRPQGGRLRGAVFAGQA
jgi:hypothetical protein